MTDTSGGLLERSLAWTVFVILNCLGWVAISAADRKYKLINVSRYFRQWFCLSHDWNPILYRNMRPTRGIRRSWLNTCEIRVHSGQRPELGLNYLLVGSSGTRNFPRVEESKWSKNFYSRTLELEIKCYFSGSAGFQRECWQGSNHSRKSSERGYLLEDQDYWRSHAESLLTALVLKKALTYLWRPTIGRGRPSTSLQRPHRITCKSTTNHMVKQHFCSVRMTKANVQLTMTEAERTQLSENRIWVEEKWVDWGEIFLHQDVRRQEIEQWLKLCNLLDSKIINTNCCP